MLGVISTVEHFEIANNLLISQFFVNHCNFVLVLDPVKLIANCAFLHQLTHKIAQVAFQI